MTELTAGQLQFLAHHEIPMSALFDAAGMGRTEYHDVMKELGKFVAVGVTPCRESGHTLRQRSGHCKTASLESPVTTKFDIFHPFPSSTYLRALGRQRVPFTRTEVLCRPLSISSGRDGIQRGGVALRRKQQSSRRAQGAFRESCYPLAAHSHSPKRIPAT